MQEPKDGDFVAYIEALQRESAARLAQHQGMVADVAASPKSAGPSFDKPSAAEPAPGVEQTLARFARRDDSARFVKAAVAAVAGAVFLLNWLGNGGVFTFVLAVVLLGYAIPRLVAAWRTLASQPSNRAAIDHVFGRSGTLTKSPKR